MINAYTFILFLFTVTGAAVSVWGWLSLRKTRTQSQWSSTTGEIITAQASSEEDDLLPLIEYRYQVGEQAVQARLRFASGTSPSEQLQQLVLNKYPLGASVTVYFNPQDPQQTTLEPGKAGGDALILIFGLGMLVLGLFMLVFGW